MGTMAVLTLFLLGSLALTLQNLQPSRNDQDAKAALAAAQAGVDEYISRLNVNDSYWTLGNTDATNAAFTPAGRDIPGTGAAAGKFRYEIVNGAAEIAKTGQILLKVTGTSSARNGQAPIARTMTATLAPKGFLRYIYFSDVEVLDPAVYSAPSGCDKYYYAGRSSTSGCAEIRFTTGDVINGPLHSNDALQIQGSVLFTRAVTESSWSNPPNPAKRWWGSGTPSSGTPGAPGYLPVYAPPLSLPPGNEELLQYVEPRIDDPSATPGPGCLYSGLTRIKFQGTTMKVLSPSTTSAPSRCLNTANRANEQTVAIPPVIYINSTSTSCTYGATGYPAKNGGTSSNWESTTAGTTTDYSCTRGTALVQGSVSGQVTVAAKDDVVVTGDLTYTAGVAGTDVVGLVAGNYVWVYHPVNSSGSNLSSSKQPESSGLPVAQINAAVLSLRHSFLVQNWNLGNPTGTLTVQGAISQKFRGPVGTGYADGTVASGYLKNYVYDDRLFALQPPYFLKPASSPWQVIKLTDK
jgi:hypothetical protein